jgi:copper chaperone CopZ
VTIDGMGCQHCVESIKKALSSLSGINVIEVKIGEALIEGDISADLIKSTIEDVGYDVVKLTKI